MKHSPAESRRLIARWRGQDPPMPWRQIGQRLGISGQAAWRLVNERVIDPLTKPKRYHCRACDSDFESKAKRGPDRCRACGSYDWKETTK